MAEKTCSGTRNAPLCCEVSWLRRRQELEDTPVTRRTVPRSESSVCSGCGCACAARVNAALAAQQELLYDILAAVNGLAAASLTGNQQ